MSSLYIPNHTTPSNTSNPQTIPHLHLPHRHSRISPPSSQYLPIQNPNCRIDTKSPIHDPRHVNIPHRHFGENYDLCCEWCGLWSTGFETRDGGSEKRSVGGMGGGHETLGICTVRGGSEVWEIYVLDALWGLGNLCGISREAGEQRRRETAQKSGFQ